MVSTRNIMFIFIFWMMVSMVQLSGINGEGTKWAFLIAGSNGFTNYRHQADVCHAYQVLKDGGLKDENIVVMMYDDIANNPENPLKGYIFNNPTGGDVYKGVPKDYTGTQVNVQNIFDIIRGDASYLTGGSGKVLKTGPEDTIFIYISSHGEYGRIGILDTSLWSMDFVDVLTMKRESNSCKKMVIYVESCKSGSMFNRYLTAGHIGIYATTASLPSENSRAYYCSDKEIPQCLGDFYSISWMEDSESHDGTTRTLQQQYLAVRDRTYTSHVTQYGDMNMQNDTIDTYIGSRTVDAIDHNPPPQFNTTYIALSDDEAHLLYLKHELKRAPNGTEDQLKAQKALEAEIAHRKRDDRNVILMWKHLFGKETSLNMLVPDRQLTVDEFNCLKMLTKTYDHHCGVLSTYGWKYTTTFANMCSAGFSMEQIIEAISHTCPLKN